MFLVSVRKLANFLKCSLLSLIMRVNTLSALGKSVGSRFISPTNVSTVCRFESLSVFLNPPCPSCLSQAPKTLRDGSGVGSLLVMEAAVGSANGPGRSCCIKVYMKAEPMLVNLPFFTFWSGVKSSAVVIELVEGR
jgi:hypothetical protein